MARILLVDDEKMARTLYGDYLRAAGHTVTAVGRYEEVREALAAAEYDAGGDGPDPPRRRRDGGAPLHQGALPGHRGGGDHRPGQGGPAVRAIKSGAAEYLVKPVAPEALQHAVRRALTTRDLLQENASLRQYVSLLEMGQRIATTLDCERLAIAVLQRARGADAGRRGGAAAARRRPPAARRLGGPGGGAGHPARAPARRPAQGVKTPRSLEGLPGGHTRASPSPRATGGAAARPDRPLLLGRAAGATSGEVASYLSRYYALALRNLGASPRWRISAYMDDLTHLYNMRYLHLVLDREVKSAQQTRAPSACSSWTWITSRP